MKYCSNCGKRLDDYAPFCDSCAPNKTNTRYLSILLGIHVAQAICLFLAIISFFLPFYYAGNSTTLAQNPFQLAANDTFLFWLAILYLILCSCGFLGSLVTIGLNIIMLSIPGIFEKPTSTKTASKGFYVFSALFSSLLFFIPMIIVFIYIFTASMLAFGSVLCILSLITCIFIECLGIKMSYEISLRKMKIENFKKQQNVVSPQITENAKTKTTLNITSSEKMKDEKIDIVSKAKENQVPKDPSPEIYISANELLASGLYDSAIKKFSEIQDYKDSKALIEKCIQFRNDRNERIYVKAIELMEENFFIDAINKFKQIADYKDSKSRMDECKKKIAENGVEIELTKNNFYKYFSTVKIHDCLEIKPRNNNISYRNCEVDIDIVCNSETKTFRKISIDDFGHASIKCLLPFDYHLNIVESKGTIIIIKDI